VNASPTTVIFDLDGTLIDTAPDLTGALNRVLEEEGLPPVDQAETRRMVGRGARALIDAALSAAGAPPDQGRLSR
jgi:phosphoglycolate phosphatase